MANKTIEELKSEAAVIRDATEEGENTATRVGNALIDMIDTLSESVSINAIKGYVVIDSTSELPASPTADQQQKGYLLDTTLYVWVGEDGDTLDGKYQSAELQGPAGATGPAGADGHDGVDLGEVVLVDDLTTGGRESALSAEQGKKLNETKVDVDYECASSTLAAAIAEVPSADRKVGLVISIKSKRYKYMGKYYTDIDWLSEGAWLDLDNADKYNVYYFRLCPTIEGHVDNASINSSGVVTTGTKMVTDFIEIPVGGVDVCGGWLSRYTIYDSNKDKLSTALLYGKHTFKTSEGAYFRVEYTDELPLGWKVGYVASNTSSTVQGQLPHVEVIENYENLVDYEDNAWAAMISPFIRLKKGETINLLKRDEDAPTTGTGDGKQMSVQAYDTNQDAYGSLASSIRTYKMPIDGYIKIGNSSQSARAIARYCTISKSVARTRAKKRLLVVGDSISVYTWDNTASADKKQGYPYFLATQGNHEISVTNQAVSGQTSTEQLSALKAKDMSVYDAVTILIGTNNYGYNNTIAAFKSDLEEMIDYIISENPACKIGFMTLIHRSSAWNGTAEVANAAGNVLSDYCDAIKEVAQKYALPVLDLWNECQCNFNITTYKTNYSSHESDPNGDGLHPTNEAHRLFLTPLIREFLKRLLV